MAKITFNLALKAFHRAHPDNATMQHHEKRSADLRIGVKG